MFVLRFKKKRFIVALIVVLAVITVFIILINADFTHVEDYAEFNSENYSLKADSSDDRIKFFQQLGINAVDESVDEVIIPQDFNSIYESITKLRKIRIDLSNYAGKPAKRYTYSIDDGKKAVILVYKNRIIGGHITSGVYGEDYLPLF